MKKLKLWACCLLLLTAAWLQAQRTITGIVADEAGEALIGATVVIKGLNEGNVTDVDGRYSLNVSVEAKFLIYSYTVYASREIEIGAEDIIDVTLRLSAAFLEEIVVTGLAIGTPTTKVGFNIAKINEDQLKETPGVNAAMALQGKIPGVVVTSGVGKPGSNPAIRIRGSSNLFGFRETPLVIVDGVQLQEPSNISDINSEDIETIEVIKGAAATSLYGSRAANGVINIITKKGSDQIGVTDITLRNEFGKSSIVKQLKTAQHHANQLNQDGTVDYNSIADDHIADNEFSQYFDHQELFFDPGSYMTNTLSVGHRSQNSNYFFSLNNTRQSGIISTLSGYSRQSARLNIGHKINKALELSISNYYAQSNNDEPSFQGPGSPFFALLFLPPDVDLTQPNEEDGSPYDWDAGQRRGANQINPLYEFANQDADQKIERYSSAFGLKFTPVTNFILEGLYTLDRRSSAFEGFVDKGYLADQSWKDGYYYRSNSKRSYQTFTSKATFTQDFKDFSITSQGAIIYESDENTFFDIEAFDFRFKGIRSLSNSGSFSSGNPGDPPVNRTQRSSNDFEIKTLNYYLTGNVDWKDKVILDGLVRWDGSSLFGADNRWNTFYRGSLAYRLSQDIKITNVQELKLRASYGTAGNRPQFDYRFETLSGDGEKRTLGNKDLRSSLTREIEIGVDTRILDRINLTLNYSAAVASDLFYDIPLPAAAGGFQRQWQNIDSKIESKVFEASFGIDLITRKEFNLSAGLTFDRLRQKVTKFDFPDFIDYIYLVRAGEIFGALIGRKFARSEADLFPHQREGKSFVVNHEGWLVEADKLGTLDEQPIRVEEDDGNMQFIMGDANPDFNMGFNLNAHWKGLQLYALFQWRQGGDVYNLTKQWTFRDLRHGDIDQFGRPEHQKKPVEYYSAFYDVNSPNNYFIEDATYLKLRELAVSYHFKSASLGAVGNVIKGLKISFIGRNLFTLTKFTGYDPEVAWFDETFDGTLSGLDGYGYPNFRTISGALEIKF